MLSVGARLLNADVSQGTVAMRLTCVCCKFTGDSDSEIVLKIGEYLTKL